MNRPQTTYEKVIEKCQKFCQELLNEYGEPETIAVVIDWTEGNSDLPPGIIVPRKSNDSISIEIVFQLIKLIILLTSNIKEVMKRYMKALKRLDEIIVEKQKILEKFNETGTSENITK